MRMKSNPVTRNSFKLNVDQYLVNAGAIKTFDASKRPMYDLKTKHAGVLHVKVMDDGEWLACVFKDMDKAVPYFIKNQTIPGYFNSHSGKWNWMDLNLLEEFQLGVRLLLE